MNDGKAALADAEKAINADATIRTLVDYAQLEVDALSGTPLQVLESALCKVYDCERGKLPQAPRMLIDSIASVSLSDALRAKALAGLAAKSPSTDWQGMIARAEAWAQARKKPLADLESIEF